MFKDGGRAGNDGPLVALAREDKPLTREDGSTLKIVRLDEAVGRLTRIFAGGGAPGEVPQGLAWANHMAPAGLCRPLLARAYGGGPEPEEASYQRQSDQELLHPELLFESLSNGRSNCQDPNRCLN
jgi:hypothetical protein